jgi:hypothetical protein
MSQNPSAECVIKCVHRACFSCLVLTRGTSSRTTLFQDWFCGSPPYRGTTNLEPVPGDHKIGQKLGSGAEPLWGVTRRDITERSTTARTPHRAVSP